MKKLIKTLFIIPLIVFGQAPQGVNYQAVAYDANGLEIANQEISIRLGILLETADAESSYSETHQITTNNFGLFSLVISQGNSTDDFSSLNWENGAYLKVELDEDLDGNYTLMGVSSFNAVPYAKYSDYSPTDNRIDSLVSLFEYKFNLLSSPLQESLDMGASFSDLYSVGFQQDQLIGLNHQGGIIFYMDETGEHGLVAALEDLTEGSNMGYTGTPEGFEWGCYQQIVSGADGIAIGTGYQNTLDISAQNCQTENGGITAAQATLNYESEGYTDWFLPSKEELEEMYGTIGNGGNIGGFETSDYPYYWSSSENYNYYAWRVLFSSGTTGSDGKDNSLSVRAVRAF
jgi:hypothetical protein